MARAGRACHTGAAARAKDSAILAIEHKRTLLAIARRAIEAHLQRLAPPDVGSAAPELLAARGVFVTLTRDGELRGCIGYVEPVKALARAVAELAVAAAARDTRFSPVTAAELSSLDVEISALSPLREIADPLTAVDVGRHGLAIRKAGRSGVLLPQVAPEHGWDVITFLEHTCRKARLPADAWRDGASILVFESEAFAESDPDIRAKVTLERTSEP